MKSILTDLGENYEYVRTIFDNKLQLKKLDIIEDTADVIGILIMSICFLLMSMMMIVVLIGILAFFLYSYTGSVLIVLSALLVLILTLSITIYMFKETLIFRPVTKLFFSSFNSKF